MRRTILALLLLGTTTPALAQTPPAPPPEGARTPWGGPMRGGMLARADANGDGTITRAEAIAAADARFDRLDANHDGLVKPEEMRVARDAMHGRGGPPPPPPSTDGVRPERRGALESAMTREDSRGRTLEAFARADANGDGTIDQSEIARLRAMRGPRGDRPAGDMPPPPPQD